MIQPIWDIAVVGGGHAGIEAAWVGAKRGLRVALITLSKQTIGAMSCNPAVGGQGKGQLVKELDILGGLMPRVADAAGIQFKRLNTKKGPAVWSSRVQCDKIRYAQLMQRILSQHPLITLVEGEVVSITPQTDGYLLTAADGSTWRVRSVVLTMGTFLRGHMHVGSMQSRGGRYGDASADSLSGSLSQTFGITWRRFKTGTPPRLDAQSIEWDRMAIQLGDSHPGPFSLWSAGVKNQIACYLTHTCPDIHDYIAENIHHSPLYNGQIASIGPRYCPSIEDKVMRFPNRERHQLFLEPESMLGNSVYINGLSTSLPSGIQEWVVNRIPGLEKVRFLRYGYAVEYDSIDPQVLLPTLRHQDLPRLYFAGQINGTSGYEEAASQGWVAGLSATCELLDEPPPVFLRSQSYIGVLTDDITRVGAPEPYRMFTARCEYRMSIREDNAIGRLLPMAEQYGLLSDSERDWCCHIRDAQRKWLSTSDIQRWTWDDAPTTLRRAVTVVGIHMDDFLGMVRAGGGSEEANVPTPVWEHVYVEIKYAGYLEKEARAISRLLQEQQLPLPRNLVYEDIPGLSWEAKQRLTSVRPRTIVEARTLFGVTPADVLVLLRYLDRTGCDRRVLREKRVPRGTQDGIR